MGCRWSRVQISPPRPKFNASEPRDRSAPLASFQRIAFHMVALLEARRAGLLGRQHWLSNVVSGIVVGVVALPLAMAFAIASGAKPEQGLYTAIVAGFLVSALWGSRG